MLSKQIALITKNIDHQIPFLYGHLFTWTIIIMIVVIISQIPYDASMFQQ